MHELFLVGQVPGKRADQVIHILTGLTASQPVRVIERHAVYKPIRSALPSEETKVGGSQAITSTKNAASGPVTNKELLLLRLVKSLKEKDFGVDPIEDGRNDWRMVVWNPPERAQQKALLRKVTDIPITSNNNLAGYMEDLEYTYVMHIR
jgi:hypothetical protein